MNSRLGGAVSGVVVAATVAAACRDDPPPPESREVLVPAGEFRAGANCTVLDQRDAYAHVDPADFDPGCDCALRRRRTLVKLPAFYVDRNLVTRDEYNACVAANQCANEIEPPDDPGVVRGPIRDRYAFHNSLAHVRQEHAAQYCKWRGARLPSGDEIERVARGADGKMEYADFHDCSAREDAACLVKAGPAGVRSVEYVEQWISLRNDHYPRGATMGTGFPYCAGKVATTMLPDPLPYAAFRCARNAE